MATPIQTLRRNEPKISILDRRNPLYTVGLTLLTSQNFSLSTMKCTTDVRSLAGLTNLNLLMLTGTPIPSDSSTNAQPICPVNPSDICRF